jgi:hypothetical protein
MNDDTLEMDWRKVKTDLQDALKAMHEHLKEEFDRICIKKIFSDGREAIDPTIYDGSAGVLYAMLRHSNSVKVKSKGSISR